MGRHGQAERRNHAKKWNQVRGAHLENEFRDGNFFFSKEKRRTFYIKGKKLQAYAKKHSVL